MGTDEQRATLELICSPQAIVLLSPPAAREQVEIGKAVTKSYAFGHDDSDAASLETSFKDAAAGASSKTRLWMRVSEHQLVRIECQLHPLFDADGKVQQVLFRTAPTHKGPRKTGELETKPLIALEAAASGPDLLAMPMPIGVLRVSLRDGLVQGVNDALADLLGQTKSAVANLPLSELFDPASRQAIGECLARLPREHAPLKPLDVQLADSGRAVRLLFIPDSQAETDPDPIAGRKTYVFVRDLAPEQAAADMARRADQLAALTAQQQTMLQQVQALIEHAPIGLALFDGDALRLSNRRFDELSGRHTSGSPTFGTTKIGDTPVTPPMAQTFDLAAGLRGAILVDDAPQKKLETALSKSQGTIANLLQTPLLASGEIDEAGKLQTTNIAWDEQFKSTPWTSVLAGELFDATVAIARAGNASPVRTLRTAAGNEYRLQALPGSGPGKVLLLVIDQSALQSMTSEIEAVRQQHRAYLEQLPQPLLIIDKSLALVQANRAARRMLAIDGQPLPQPITRLWPAIDSAASLAALRNVLASGQSDQLTLRGAGRTWRVPILRSGDVLHLLPSDQSQFDHAQQRIELLERQLELAGETGELGVFFWDLTDNQLQTSSRSRDLFALDEEPQTLAELMRNIDSEDRDAFDRALFESMEPDGADEFEVRLRIRGSDTPRLLRLVGRVRLDEQQTPTSVVCVAVDDGNRQLVNHELAQARRALAVRAAEVEALLEAVPGAVRIEGEGVTQRASGVSRIGKLDNAPRRSDELRLRNHLGLAIQPEQLPLVEARAGRRSSVQLAADIDGRDVHLTCAAAPIIVDGRVVGTASIELDCTEQVQAENEVRRLGAELRRREAEIRGIYANTGVGIASLDNTGRVIELNQQLSILLGKPRADVLGKTIAELAIEADRDNVTQQFDAVRTGELSSCSGQVHLERRDGLGITVQLTIAPQADSPQPDSLVALVQDLSATTHAEKLLQEQQKANEKLQLKHRAIFDTIDEAAVLVDDDNAVLEINAPARRLLQLGEQSPMSWRALFDKWNLDSEAGETIAADDLLARSPQPLDVKLSRPGRGGFMAAFSTRSIELESQRVRLVTFRDVSIRAAMEQQHARLENDLQKAQIDLASVRADTHSTQHAAEATVVEIAQQYRIALAPLDRLLSGVDSDLRLPADARRDFSEVREIGRLLGSIARLPENASQPTPQEVELPKLLQQAIEICESEPTEARVDITFTSPAGLPSALAQRAILRHGLASLLLEATRTRDRKLQVHLKHDADQIELSLELPGESLALDTALSFCRAAGADIDLTAKSLTLRLPAVAAAPALEAMPAIWLLETLLVEDHASTRRVLQRTLERSGCRVTAVDSIAAAREAASKTQFAILVCDLTLSGDSPLAFARELPSLQRSIAIGAAEIDDASILAAGYDHSLPKPVNLPQLQKFVEASSVPGEAARA